MSTLQRGASIGGQTSQAQDYAMEKPGKWRGFDPAKIGQGRHWMTPTELDRLYDDGRVYIPERGGVPKLKRYEKELTGIPVDSIWEDVPSLGGLSKSAHESLGYPTQKPIALLNRIISCSSNEADIVLDAFCGCGTALEVAEKQGRQWVGIDTSPTACRVMAKRLKDECRLIEDERLWRIGRGFVIRDLPWSEEKLRQLPPFEFENWAVIALGGVANKAQVGDMGIDGRIFPVSALPLKKKPPTKETSFSFMDEWYPMQVKQKDKAGRPDIDQFETAMLRASQKKGFFISFAYTSDAITEIGRFFKKTGNVIVPFTVSDILDDEIAHKIA
jgi:hypothetical protein